MTASHLVAAALCDRHGVFTTAQLRQAGISARKEKYAVERGMWSRVVIGAYVMGNRPVSLAQRAAAAAAITSGVVSHLTAATLHGLADDDGLTHVTVARKERALQPGLTVHHLTLGAGDVVEVAGIRVTSRQRSVVDCLAVLDFDAAMTLAREATFRRIIDADTVRRAAAQRFRWHGTPQLRIIARLLAEPGRSASEHLAHRILRKGGFTGWVVNVVVHDDLGSIGEVDILFETAKLVVEIDGRDVHSQPEVFQRDRAKQNRLMRAGYTVLRFTWDDLTQRPDTVIATIRSLLPNESARIGHDRSEEGWWRAREA